MAGRLNSACLDRELRSGRTIGAASPPYLVAAKLEAFKGRGHGDFLRSRDFADVIALVGGRAELDGEIEDADADLRYVANEAAELLAADRFLDGIFGALRPDAGSQARAEEVVLPRLRRLAAEPR